MLGAEARTKGARVLLAPTVNMHRSPLAGPELRVLRRGPAAVGAAGRRLRPRASRAQGVATTVKHLVGNDAEHQRYTMSSDVDERALREIYLRPFEMAVREGGSLGRHDAATTGSTAAGAPSDPTCCGGILRDEWGFDGFVVTDWFGVTGTAASAEAGVDLEMPGPGRAFGPALAAAVRAGEVDEKLVDAQVTRLLSVFERIGRARRRRTGRRDARSTGPSTGPWPGGPPPRPWSCWPTTGCCPLDRGGAAHGGGHRAERRPHRDHGRRIGLAPGPLPGHAAGGAHRRPSATA